MHYDEHHGKGQFLWTHTTASMGIAYQTTSDETATTIMSRIPNSNQNPGSDTYILVESIPFSTKNYLSNGHCNGSTTTASVLEVAADPPPGGRRQAPPPRGRQPCPVLRRPRGPPSPG